MCKLKSPDTYWKSKGKVWYQHNSDKKLGWKAPSADKEHSDKTGYYTGYCQCPCKKCSEGSKHCQGLTCRGD